MLTRQAAAPPQVPSRQPKPADGPATGWPPLGTASAPQHGVESGVTKPQGGGASGGGSGGKKRKHLDGDALAAAMATESPAQKKMAAAWETEAAAKSAEVALQLIQQLGSAPDAFKPLLEARIKKLLEDGNGPEAPPAAQ